MTVEVVAPGKGGKSRAIVAERLYGKAEAAATLSISSRQIDRLADLYEATGGREGLGPRVLIGTQVRFRASALERFTATCEARH